MSNHPYKGLSPVLSDSRGAILSLCVCKEKQVGTIGSDKRDIQEDAKHIQKATVFPATNEMRARETERERDGIHSEMRHL